MKRLNYSLLLILLVSILGCDKEIEENLPSPVEEIQLRTMLGLDGKINEFVSNLENPTEYGTLNWNKSIHYEHPNFEFYSIPFENSLSDSIEYTLTGFEFSCSGDGCYIAINDRIYFDYFKTNLDYKDDLSISHLDFETENFAYFNDSSRVNNPQIEVRTEKVIIIIFENGETWFINLTTGTVTSTGGSGSGCFGSGGTITFWDGSSVRFKGNGWSSSAGSTNGSGWSFGDSPSINWYSGGVNNNGGGGSYNQPFNCRDGSFWGAVSPQSKKQALAEIENIFDLYNIDHCESLDQTDCMTSSDIICMAFEGDCMQITNGEFDVSHFNVCMSELLAAEDEFPPISADCSIKAEEFIMINNISMTPEELVYLTNSYSYCSGSQANFDNYVCDELPYHLLVQFSEKYGISISNSLAQDILSQVTTCNGVEFDKEVADILLLKYNDIYFNESPTLTDFQNDQDGTYLGRLKDAVKALRAAGVDWYAAFIEELIECEEFETVGDLRDTWYMVKDFISEYNNFIICQREQEQAEWMMAIFSPSNIGMILSFPTFGTNMSRSFRVVFRVKFANTAKGLCSDLSRGFDTFNKFKSVYGNAGQGKAWHHIVE